MRLRPSTHTRTLSTDLVTVHPRQHDVEDDHVIAALAGTPQTYLAVVLDIISDSMLREAG
jgi:hypothetical protein